jgi:2-phosphosulfolactate phosphatase
VLRARVSVFVIVDVLSFSTAVDVAVSNGAVVYPFAYGDPDAALLAAERVGAVLAQPRRAAGGQFTLSPASLMRVSPGLRLMLPSPNGVIPAGERWPDGSLRPAIEDWLGAGAILHHLDLPCSPEAELARGVWRQAGPDFARLIRGSVSGRELEEGGFSGDVALALAHNVSTTAPLLAQGAYRAA